PADAARGAAVRGEHPLRSAATRRRNGGPATSGDDGPLPEPGASRRDRCPRGARVHAGGRVPGRRSPHHRRKGGVRYARARRAAAPLLPPPVPAPHLIPVAAVLLVRAVPAAPEHHRDRLGSTTLFGFRSMRAYTYVMDYRLAAEEMAADCLCF